MNLPRGGMPCQSDAVEDTTEDIVEGEGELARYLDGLDDRITRLEKRLNVLEDELEQQEEPKEW